MQGLDSIRYDAQRRQMTIGGGVHTGAFANATFSQGMEVSKSSSIQLHTHTITSNADIVHQLLVLALVRE